MRYFDPHIHMLSRTTDDYERMAAAGVAGVVEPAFWQGQPRTHVGTFIDYFDSLVGWERFRARQFGIHHFCTMGLNPKEANDVPLAEATGWGRCLAALGGKGVLPPSPFAGRAGWGRFTPLPATGHRPPATGHRPPAPSSPSHGSR